MLAIGRALGVYAVGEPTEAKSFERYASQFLSENMDGHSLLNLTCVKLKNKLNVDNMDHRRKIFDWIEHLMVASGSDEQSTALHATRRSSHIRSSSWQQLDLEMHALQQLRTQQGQDLKVRGILMCIYYIQREIVPQVNIRAFEIRLIRCPSGTNNA